mgnify:CR=1 FL=1
MRSEITQTVGLLQTTRTAYAFMAECWGRVAFVASTADERVLDWVRTAHSSTAYTTSVCTGSLVLAAAALFLLSPAAETVTGAVLDVWGGTRLEVKA